MFEIRNENEVWYKSPEMIDWVQYGWKDIASVYGEDEDYIIYEVLTIDMEIGQYKRNTSFAEFTYENVVYPVVDGLFKVQKEQPVATNTKNPLQEIQATLDYLAMMSE